MLNKEICLKKKKKIKKKTYSSMRMFRVQKSKG